MVRFTLHDLERDGNVGKERADAVSIEIGAGIEGQAIDTGQRLSGFRKQRPQSSIAVSCPVAYDLPLLSGVDLFQRDSDSRRWTPP